MIQRIQSVYYLVAVVLLVVFSFFTEYNLCNILENEIQLFIPAIGSLLLAVLNLILIFLFKNRKLQSKISGFLIVLVGFILGYFIYIKTLNEFYKDWSLYVLIFALFFILMAKNHVDKDQKLVQSADRLR